MSIAGNLADLTLTELLQTMALSRKSGVLEIYAQEEVAWLGLREGRIVRVAMSEEDLTRAGALKAAGVSPDAPPDEIEACLWDAAVTGILRLFDWREGEFAFSPEQDPDQWRGPEGLVLPTSLSPEFLALEGARRADEGGAAQQTDAEGQAEAALSEAPDKGPVVVVLDHDPVLLAQIKNSLVAEGWVVHALQQGEMVLQRVQSYLLRGEIPALVVGEGAGEGLARWDQLIVRTRRMAPDAHIVLLRDPESAASGPSVSVSLVRCSAEDADEAVLEKFLSDLAQAVRPDA